MDTTKTQEIKQGNRVIMSSTDGVSIPMIFNNLTGKNFANKSEYKQYIKSAIASGTVTKGPIYMLENGEVVREGNVG